MISFAIPAHNEEGLLPRTLAAIHAAAKDGGPYEIVVADDSSSDRTAEVAREHGARVVRIEARKIAASRNAAARASSGDPVIFIDADTQITPGTLRAILEALRAGAAGAGARIRFDGKNPGWTGPALAVFQGLLNLAGATGGACVFCTRAVFNAVGGFDETYYASEELHFAKAIKRHGRFVIIKEPVITSGRKLRTYSAGEMVGLLIRNALTLGRLVKGREGLEIWYGPRRPDPQGASDSSVWPR